MKVARFGRGGARSGNVPSSGHVIGNEVTAHKAKKLPFPVAAFRFLFCLPGSKRIERSKRLPG